MPFPDFDHNTSERSSLSAGDDQSQPLTGKSHKVEARHISKSDVSEEPPRCLTLSRFYTLGLHLFVVILTLIVIRNRIITPADTISLAGRSWCKHCLAQVSLARC